MKPKQNARQKREAETRRRKEAFSPPGKEAFPAAPETPAAPKPAPFRAERFPDRTPEEETREFLEYLERYGVPAAKETRARPAGRKPGAAGAIQDLNLEEGMPTVSEALQRLNLGLQGMRFSRAGAVRLIHGYGSTGRGGKIRDGVRSELAAMKRRKQIRDYIPGEDFGPTDAASRRLAEQDGRVARDPDYGRMNHGITIVVL